MTNAWSDADYLEASLAALKDRDFDRAALMARMAYDIAPGPEGMVRAYHCYTLVDKARIHVTGDYYPPKKFSIWGRV